MKSLIIIFTLVLISGCSYDLSDTTRQKLMDTLIYVKDHKNNLCFAYIAINARYRLAAGLATVPCEKVGL